MVQTLCQIYRIGDAEGEFHYPTPPIGENKFVKLRHTIIKNLYGIKRHIQGRRWTYITIEGVQIVKPSAIFYYQEQFKSRIC